MRIVRRAALVCSLALIVVIVVMYVARRSQLTDERDRELAVAAELAVSQVSSTIGVIEIAANTGRDAEPTVAAVSEVVPGFGVCAIDDRLIHCGGDGEPPDRSVLEAHLAARRARIVPTDHLALTLDATSITFDADGPDLSLVARAPIRLGEDVGDSTPAVRVSAQMPERGLLGEFTSDGGDRSLVLPVDVAPGVFVTATADDTVVLPVAEQLRYGLGFVVALIVFLLTLVSSSFDQRRLRRRADLDHLTGLYNRAGFVQRAAEALSRADRQGTGACLLLFDLDHFKQINDRFGHVAGDEMLGVVAGRLRQAVRDGDVVSRWGGDEFVVLMPGISDDDKARSRACQLADQIGGQVRLDAVGVAAQIELSVGVAVRSPHGADVDALVEAADRAMYCAKRDGVVCRSADVDAPVSVSAPL